MAAKKKPILIPVVHFPGGGNGREPKPPCRIVPHYAYNTEPGVGLIARTYGYEAHPRWNPGDMEMPTDWLAEPVWPGWLQVVGYHHGRSSSCYAVRILTHEAGSRPVEGLMSCAAFLSLIPRLIDGQVQGDWTAVKRGQNYMIVEAA